MIRWCFDFVSPYAYFGLHTLRRLGGGVHVHYQPVLFAGLLKHWGQKGPAEIAPKRVWTYRSCLWWAQQNNVPFRMPAAHPFNPLPYLRLSIAAGNSAAAIKEIFKALWTTGADPADPGLIASVAASLGVPLERTADADVKDSLRIATERAAQEGVFGVPTLLIDEHLFWGSDAVDFASAYLKDPTILATEEMRSVPALPFGASRSP
jgi:2-hydroxychromene-2-carboxylate isomerase